MSGVNIKEYVKSFRFSPLGGGGGCHDSWTELEVTLSTRTSKGADRSENIKRIFKYYRLEVHFDIAN